MMCKMTFLLMWHNWCWHWYHMLLLAALSMTPLHLLGQDNWIEVWITFWSCDTTGAGIGIMWCWQLCQCYHLHSFGQDDWIEVQYDFLVKWHHWHNMLSMALLIAPMHSLGQDDQNEVQCDILVYWQHWVCNHIMPMTLLMHHCIP